MKQAPRILVVEDETLEARSLRAVLVHLGYQVTATVASGEAAIEQVAEAPPDLVLLDIHLAGGLDGIDTGARLHALAPVPLIFVTALRDESLLRRMTATEPYGFLLKPYQPRELQAAIELALYKHSLAEELREANRRLQQEIDVRRKTEQLIQQLNDRLRAQNESLQASEARFHRMADNIQDGLVIVEGGQVVYLNARASAILGYSRERAVGMSMADFFALHVWPLPKPAPAGYVGVVSEQLEIAHARPDGELRWLQHRTTTDYQDGRPVQVYVALTDITERKQMEANLREAGIRDAVTGLYNRTFFDEEVRRLQESRDLVASVIIADLDGLKLVNDQHGHPAGDEMLRRVAAVLRHSCRASDVIARIGGDEFGVLLPGTPAAQAEAKLGYIRASLSIQNQAHADSPVSLSLGVATAESGGPTLTAAIGQADDRMYKDKTSRRTRGAGGR